MVNTAYAYLAEQADIADHAELVLMAHVEKKHQKDLCQRRRKLDDWLNSPMGVAAEDEKALVRFLTA